MTDRSSGAVPLGKNPPEGAILYYALPATIDTTAAITLEIVDAKGLQVRKFSSRATPGNSAKPIPAKVGLNRTNWDLQHEAPATIPGFLHQGGREGRLAGPGTYVARLTVGGSVQSQSFDVIIDPNSTAKPAEWEKRAALAQQVDERVTEVRQSVVQLQRVREQTKQLSARAKDLPISKEVDAQVKAITAKLDAMESQLAQPKWKTFQDVINFKPGLDEHIAYIGEQLGGTPPYTTTLDDRFRALEKEWSDRRAELQKIYDQDVAALNKLAGTLPGVVVPPVGPKA
jgi:hypothetical protein